VSESSEVGFELERSLDGTQPDGRGSSPGTRGIQNNFIFRLHPQMQLKFNYKIGSNKYTRETTPHALHVTAKKGGFVAVAAPARSDFRFTCCCHAGILPSCLNSFVYKWHRYSCCGSQGAPTFFMVVQKIGRQVQPFPPPNPLELAAASSCTLNFHLFRAVRVVETPSFYIDEYVTNILARASESASHFFDIALALYG
jgi:hypothetical protein